MAPMGSVPPTAANLGVQQAFANPRRPADILPPSDAIERRAWRLRIQAGEARARTYPGDIYLSGQIAEGMTRIKARWLQPAQHAQKKAWAVDSTFHANDLEVPSFETATEPGL